MCIHYLPEWAQQINSRNKQYSLLKLPTWWHRWSRERGEGRQRCKPRLESERGSGTLRGGLLMKLWRHHLDLRWMGILGYCFPKINVLSKVSTPKVHQKYEKVSEKRNKVGEKYIVVKKSELSADGTKRDVENTPKFTRLDCILAQRYSLGPPPEGWHRT